MICCWHGSWPRVLFGPASFYYLYTPSWLHFEETWCSFSLLCGWHPTLPVCQTHWFFSTAFLSSCLVEIKHWLSANFLKLNGNKTEALLIGTRSVLSKSNCFSLFIDNMQYLLPHRLKVGCCHGWHTILWNSNNNITRTAYFHLRNINRLRPFLSTNNTAVLVHTLLLHV